MAAETARWDLKVWYPPGRIPGRTLAVRGLGLREEMPACVIDRPRGSADWLFIAFASEVAVSVRGAEHRVPAPALVVWSPRLAQRYGRPDALWSHSWIHASGAEVDSLVRTAGLVLGEPVSGFPAPAMEECIIGMHRELDRDAPDPAVVRLHLELLIRHAVRAQSGAPPAPEPWPSMRRYLEEHLAQRITLAALSRRFGRSPQRLCEGFRQRFGMPPIEFLIRLRLDRARVLLRDRNRSIAEVAAEVGYLDVPHFTKLFRRRCGCTPGSLR